MFDLATFLKKTDAPKEATGTLLEAQKQLTGQAYEAFSNIMNAYLWLLPPSAAGTYARLDAVAERTGIQAYTLRYLFYAACAPTLLRRYQDQNISEDIFWDTMSDLNYKLLECRKQYHIWGISTVGWYTGFFNLTRFALGRLQFEVKRFAYDSFEVAGCRVQKGDPVLNMHIPSSAKPFDEAARLDAYRRAYAFFDDRLPGKVKPFVCNSWLLWPEHEHILPPTSNIVGFLHDFTILGREEDTTGHDLWRIFFDKADLPPEQLPRTTSVERAYADHLATGKPTGTGYGVFFFDGERILR